LIRKYDKDCDKALSYREFITALSPKTQYSLRAKDLDKVQLNGVMPAVSVKNQSQRLKENIRPSAPAFSKASKSTTAMSVNKG
jgi:hypothetical protein